MIGRALGLCFVRTCWPRRSLIAVDWSLDALQGRIGRVRFDAKPCRAESTISLSIVYNCAILSTEQAENLIWSRTRPSSLDALVGCGLCAITLRKIESLQMINQRNLSFLDSPLMDYLQQSPSAWSSTRLLFLRSLQHHPLYHPFTIVAPQGKMPSSFIPEEVRLIPCLRKMMDAL